MVELIDKSVLVEEINTWAIQCNAMSSIVMLQAVADVIERHPAITEAEIRAKAIEEFAEWCYVNGIDFSYMQKATDTEPFCKRVIDKFNAEQLKESE